LRFSELMAMKVSMIVSLSAKKRKYFSLNEFAMFAKVFLSLFMEC
jgi:hypothetical protein